MVAKIHTRMPARAQERSRRFRGNVKKIDPARPEQRASAFSEPIQKTPPDGGSCLILELMNPEQRTVLRQRRHLIVVVLDSALSGSSFADALVSGGSHGRFAMGWFNEPT
jgi:hypothetical protein